MGWMTRAMIAAAAAGAAGCGNSGPPAELRAATYNAGLAPGFVDHAAARAPVTTAALAEQEFDLLCVQEYFVPDHWEALVDASADRYAGTSYLDPMPAEPDPDEDVAACSPEETEPLVSCVEAECPDASPDELTNCALSACEEEVNALSSDCLTCVGANLGSSLEEIIEACANGTGVYAYGGAFGIGLLSGHPTVQRDSIVLDSHLTRRGVLYAQVDAADFGDVHVFCTHLSPVFSSVPFPGEGSWEEEQVAQIDALLAFVDEKTGEGDQVMILGDLNTGPAAGDVPAEHPDHYARVEAAGFENPYLEADEVECTFCGPNLLVGGGADHDDSGIIDHVLVRGIDAVRSAARFMTDTIEVEVEGTGSVTTQYSDHYGVVVELTR
jgi:endonuclease/exonuclease/phosphatase family metal-dependent hydrolase